MDESGFTGEDLLSPQQPIFVHASTTLSDEECVALYKGHFSGTQGQELKHKNFSKRGRGQSRVVCFINAARKSQKCTVWVCHKEFTLLTYLVDWWVEPAMHLDGIDLYKNGANLGLCNMAYYCLRSFQGVRFVTEHLRRFQRMMIRRTQNNYDDFFSALYDDYLRTDSNTRYILAYFIGGMMKLGFGALKDIPKRAIDPSFTTAIETCSHWRKIKDHQLQLVHDKSSSLIKDRWLWDLITSPGIQHKSIGIPGRQAIYPMNVVRTAFEDSRSHLQLQFCDLLAGATAEWCRQFLGLSYNKDYVEKLGNAGIEELCIGKIWPQPHVDPDELGMKGFNGDHLNFLSDQLERLSREKT